MAEDDREVRRAGWQIDLGGGNQVEAELDASGQYWIALGGAVEDVSAWMKGVGGFDVRVGVERLPDGLILRLDRGDNQPPWWPAEFAPELILRIDNFTRTVQITGRGPASKEEVLLAQVKI